MIRRRPALVRVLLALLGLVLIISLAVLAGADLDDGDDDAGSGNRSTPLVVQ